MGEVVIREVEGRSNLRDWLDVPVRTRGREPGFVHLLDLMEKPRISKKAPFFTFGEAKFFVAYSDGKPVGRISAQINRRHLDLYKDATGHFGFFECVDDRGVAAALFDVAADWLRTKGMERMVGPFDLTVNDEIGIPVDDFEGPPALLMRHGARWYPSLFEAHGFDKAKDVLAYRFRPTERGSAVPDVLLRASARARAMPGITTRQFDLKQFKREADLLIDIFNDAWSHNWSFVPFSEAEIEALVKEMKPVLKDRWAHFVMVDGREVGVIVALPDVNRVIQGGNGRLFPTNVFKLASKFISSDWETFRVPLMGIRREFHKSAMVTGLLGVLMEALMRQHVDYKIDWVEFSWILEDNKGMRHAAEMLTGPAEKTYRLYAKAL